MKKLLAISIASALCLGIASHAFAGANPLISLALDMQLKTKTRSCATLASTYSSCSVINRASTVAVGVGNLDVIPVVYNFQGITAVEYGLDWHSTSAIYGQIWTKCSDLEITRATGATDFSAALVWNTCLSSAGGSSGKPTGFLRFTVYTAGPARIDFKPSDHGVITSVDCAFLNDEVHTTHAGFQAGAAPGAGDLAPCTAGPTATEAKTWSGVKALYR